jgi:biopolymer transport protein ExbB/TolQ
MIRTIGLLLLCCTLPVFSAKKKNNEDDAVVKKIAMVEQLRKEYRQARDELQRVTGQRWAARQRQVERLERDRTAVQQLREEIDRAHADLARRREEYLTKEQALHREAVRLDEERDRYAFLGDAVHGKLDKVKERIVTGNPLDREARFARITLLESGGVSRAPQRLHNALVNYFTGEIGWSAQSGIGRRTIIVAGKEPRTAQVLRVGSILAYAYTPDDSAWLLSSTGAADKKRFSWVSVTRQTFKEQLAALFPVMIGEKRIAGLLPVDIIRNKASLGLITGEKQTEFAAFMSFCRKGGVTIIPLGLIVLWAILLIIGRIVFYIRAHNHDYRFIHRALDLLEKGKSGEARTWAEKQRGGLARILRTCLDHRKWNRAAAERSVRELLLKELPRLDKHLDTLAALAGAAPLLGLLGTVTGMIRMFEAITRFGTADPKLLAGGISEALVTTMVGLSVAIPLLLTHTLLNNTRNRIESDMELYAMSILNRIWPERDTDNKEKAQTQEVAGAVHEGGAAW